MHPLVDDFLNLFDGFRSAHGVYIIPPTEAIDDTTKVKGKASTITAPLTKELWDKHLGGKQGLGVIPINADSMAKFGAIDVDEYPLDLQLLNKKIVDARLPLMVCRTKSGGAHLYLFTSEFVEAKLIIDKLREFASFLGYGSCEIYPRQAKILVSRGDAGNWINMPYYGGENTVRYGIGFNGHRLNMQEFTKQAFMKCLTKDDLIKKSVEVREILQGGPPCLNRLVEAGFPQGTRNNGLFNMGVYAMKRYPGEWEKWLEEWNQKYFNPPLTAGETLAVIKSLKKKDYTYTCRAQPIQSYCDQAKCRTCEHGIGFSAVGMPRMGTLSKLNTVPPIWFLDIDTDLGTQRMELTTEDLQSPQMFQKRCLDILNVMPPVMKREGWQMMVSNLLKTLTIIEVPEEATPRGMLINHLEDFCTSRVQGQRAEDLLLGKPWTNNHEIHFRLMDFMAYLERIRFREFDMNFIACYLRDIPGGRKKYHNIKGKGVNAYVIPEETFTKLKYKLDVPDQDQGTL